jgi:hypothetical protein
VPPASLGIFDASNRDQCEVKRLRTNTPLQALVMLNDPTVLEASRVLAAKLLQDNGPASARVTKAFRLIMCRHPQEKELAILTAYYNEELKAIKKSDAEKLLSVGEYPLPVNVDKITLAAMMKVVDTIYNLEEAITKT